MFIKRYYITEGATTTAGGVVRASSKHSKINGAAMVLEGDPVDCRACGGQGVIKCVMPRISDRFEGKQYALSDDLCMCGCNPPPKLIANQTFKAQYALVVDEEPAELVAAQQGSNSAMAASPHLEGAKPVALCRLRFVDRNTGKPCPNQPYRLTLGDGKVVHGRTDSEGYSSFHRNDELYPQGAA